MSRRSKPETFDVFSRGYNLRFGYAMYVARCKREAIVPVDFRVWARVDTDADIEWEAVTQEYEKEWQ